MKIRAILTVKGEVQRVGYRDAVERIARKMKLTGYVENIEPYDVRIVCEGEKNIVESFMEQIKIKDERINVESIDLTYEKPTDEFTFFKIKRGELVEEIGERFDRANYDLKVMTEKQTDTINILKENTNLLKENTNTLTSFRDETNNNLTSLRNETNNNFTNLDSKYHVISEDMRSLKDDIHKLTEAMITIAQASLRSSGGVRKRKREA
ncbi:MAG: acylphosphatase [Euryarchaeota archaeon]|nr:acylphosphatase [Euryarchaeota archaeon]MBU4491165.1 acylphosphatase [Euryarchaeota archaeon]MCG2728173.1 acylphosphatase [Candidatus Methanoperedenaceae archaeon]